MRVVVHFEFGSPYTFLAWHRITHHPVYVGADITWRPMSLYHLTQKEGGRLNRELPNLAKYNWRDLKRWGDAYGVKVWFAKSWPTNTLNALRGHIVAEDAGRGAEWREAVFKAHWSQGLDIGDLEVLAKLGQDVGLPDVLDRIQDPDVKRRLADETEAAYAAGVCGAPFIIVEDGQARETFWGNDRLDWVEARLAGLDAPTHWLMPREDTT